MKRTFAYKAFDKDLKCRGVQYEVGYTFTEDSDKIVACKSGIHVCKNLNDVYTYYPRTYETRVCLVIIIGDEFVEEGDKIACRTIEIVRELSKEEIKNRTNDLTFNTGHRNTGYRNTGNWNTGDRNTGYRNTGDYNTGNYNTGDYNTGNHNTGHFNTGYNNTGDYNTGHRNTGDYNTGDFNTGHFNTGYNNTGLFNTITPKLTLFNQKSNLSPTDPIVYKLLAIAKRIKPTITWIPSTKMTKREKQDNPSHEIIGGYLKQTEENYKKGWINLWKTLNKEEKQLFTKLPNFDWNIFTEITGIKKGD